MKSGRRIASRPLRATGRAGKSARKTAKSNLGPPRDFVGYGRNPPHARWPGEARIAVNFNLNVEAGGEHSLLEGDKSSESILTDIGFPAYEGARSPMVESSFEYGPRVGCWRLLRIFKTFDVKISVLGVVRGLRSYPDLVRAFVEEGHEIVSHGWRWIDYTTMSEKEERQHIRLATEGIVALTGQPPVGWFGGRPSANTRRLLVEQGGYLYDRDYLGDELPFWVNVGGRHHLVVPYSYETNDNRFDQNNGISTADEFARYLIDCFDLMYEEGADRPKIMSIALHDRLIGRPARAAGLIKFLHHARNRDRVWFCTGREIAEHWRNEHPPA
ncbi:MAG TPA: polysaccharide deacetylase family protein, partial [Roseiarcus sp.]|nr:polysaccharide deacetylase family protein [Roseiarcus sp.]